MTVAQLEALDKPGQSACLINGRQGWLPTHKEMLEYLGIIPLAEVYAEASDAMQRQMSGKRSEPVGEAGYLISNDVIPF